MTRQSLLRLPTNTVRSDVSVTAKTLWLVPVGGASDEFAVVRVIGDEPFDIVGFAKSIEYSGRADAMAQSFEKVGAKTFVTQVKTDHRFVVPPSQTHMQICIES